MTDAVPIAELRGCIDFAIITIREDEFEAVLHRFSPRVPVSGGKQKYEYCRFKAEAENECRVAVVRSLEQGQTAAQSVARDVIEDLDPAWLMLVGIAGGVPDIEFTLGDVLLASRLHDFSVEAAIEGERPKYQQTGGPVHPKVARLLAALPGWRERLGDWNSESSIGRAKPPVKVPKGINARSLYGSPDSKRHVRTSLERHFPVDGPVRAPLYRVGPGATANVLVKDTKLLGQWQESARHLTHVEMEAGGVYQAAWRGNYPLLCVRGISDIVGFRRGPEWTAYACHSAAAFAHALIRSGVIELDVAPSRGAPRALSKGIAESKLLRHGAETLVGREAELQRLEDAWADPGTHVVSIVAWGGVGKTALTVEWMGRFAERNWEGVDGYFDWSFYSQGTREQGAASGDAYVAAALRHFGDPDLADSNASPRDKGLRLAELVAGRKSLLILDGLEPLQYPKGKAGLDGRLKDSAVEALLKSLAQKPMPGLCILTTREPVSDLKSFHDKTVIEWELKHLSEEAGAELLYRAGAKRAGAAEIKADDKELREASREVNGHALTLQLLGGYLGLAHGGDIRRRDIVDFQEADAEVQGGHAFRVIEAYEWWLAQAGENGIRELAVLRLLGLFDRPADPGCLAALRKKPAIAGLTEPLTGLNNAQWNATLKRLADLGLITLDATPNPRSLTPDPRSPFIDAHPLIREYFAKQLQDGHADAWRAAHRRLYEHLCERAEHRPDTLDGLQPLYQAVAHGCQAGLHEQVVADVYGNRILRGTGHDGYYSSKKLGAIGANLGAVACFFDEPWSRLSPNLSEAIQAWLPSEASFYLRALGRLTEAVEPMRAARDMAIEQKNWSEAAIRASNVSELELTLGEVSAAVTDGEQSVTFADRSGDEFQKQTVRVVLADALHHAGRREESLRVFRKAEAIQAKSQPEYPRLYSGAGFRYCGLLLSDAERAAWRVVTNPATPDGCEPVSQEQPDLLNACDEAAERAEGAQRAWREIFTNDEPLLDIALDYLTLGRAALYKTILHSAFRTPHFAFDASRDHLTAAVDGLRQAGTTHHIPRGLLTRAWLRHVMGDESGARDDLDEAWEIAERGAMRLHMANIQLTRARLFRDKAALEAARGLIKQCGYHRRDEELADAEQAAQTW